MSDFAQWPEFLNNLKDVEKYNIMTAVESTCREWSNVNGSIEGYIAASRSAGRIADREDVIRICIAELMDKSEPINTIVVNSVFGVSKPHMDSFKASVKDLHETTGRYLVGVPDGFCQLMFKKFPGLILRNIKALEKTYDDMKAIIDSINLKPELKKELSTVCADKSINTWKSLIDDSKKQINEPINALIDEKVKHEEHYFSWMVKEGMDPKLSFEESMKVGDRAMSPKDFHAWFRLNCACKQDLEM